MLPVGYTLNSLISEFPDAPLSDVNATERYLRSMKTESEAREMNELFDRQQVCTVICKHHGAADLSRLLKAIAESSSRLGVAMSGRIRSIAQFYDIEVP